MNDEPIFAHDKFSHRCSHNKYIFDESLNVVICGICKKELNPMYVIKQFMNKENRYMIRLKYLNDLMEKAIKKNRCKCVNCDKMTPIQR